MPESSLHRLFSLLDGWRDLPAYRLEPRADPFFALFLRQVLEEHLGVSLREDIIPEFPLRRGTLWGETTRAASKSVKVDYVAISTDGKAGYLVELKTDQASRREEQDAYLVAAREVGLRKLIGGILQITLATESLYIQKYVHLLHGLEQHGLVCVPSVVYEHAFPEVRAGITDALRQVENTVSEPGPAIHIVYVQPVADPAHDSIGFEEFASVIEKLDDPVAVEFAKHLRAWTSVAGTRDPRV